MLFVKIETFSGTFNTPDDLLDVYLDKDDLEFRLTQRILNNASREFKKRFQSIFEFVEINPEYPEKIKIYFHLPYDDYTEEEKEQFLQEVQDCLI